MNTQLKLLIPVLLLVSFTMACGERRNEETTKKAKNSSTAKAKPEKVAKPANVKTEVLHLGTLVESALANGVTKADHEVTYSAEIPGKIEYLSADLGDEIKRGKVLARIDFKTLKAQADQATAQHSLAKSTFDRLVQLRDEELISQQQLDEANSQMISAKAQLAIAEANLSKSIIKANHYGIVANKYTEKAEYVGPGARLYDVVDYRTIIVEANLPESQIATVMKESKVTVEISATAESYEGTIDTIIPTADKESKTFAVRIKIPNPDLKILIGMSTTVHIKSATHENVLMAAQSAVLEEQGGERSVFIAQNGKAIKRPVQLGANQDDKVVLLSGVKEGEALIVLGQRDLIDGQPINIIE